MGGVGRRRRWWGAGYFPRLPRLRWIGGGDGEALSDGEMGQSPPEGHNWKQNCSN